MAIAWTVLVRSELIKECFKSCCRTNILCIGKQYKTLVDMTMPIYTREGKLQFSKSLNTEKIKCKTGFELQVLLCTSTEYIHDMSGMTTVILLLVTSI